MRRLGDFSGSTSAYPPVIMGGDEYGRRLDASSNIHSNTEKVSFVKVAREFAQAQNGGHNDFLY